MLREPKSRLEATGRIPYYTLILVSGRVETNGPGRYVQTTEGAEDGRRGQRSLQRSQEAAGERAPRVAARIMKVSIRLLEENPELRPGVDLLRTLVYPEHPESYDVGWHSSVWSWLETHPLGGEMRRWVAATEDGEVVGHLAAVPQYYRISGERVVAYTPADYQALPGYGFHAFSLMRRPRATPSPFWVRRNPAPSTITCR